MTFLEYEDCIEGIEERCDLIADHVAGELFPSLQRKRLSRLCTSLMAGTALAGIGAAIFGHPALALPQGGQIREGQAQIVVVSPTELEVRQTSNRAIIDWQSFNIAANESVQFIQVNKLADVLNRIVGVGASEVLGALSANGRVAISNASGVVFGPNAKVDVQAIIATTANITNANFMAGDFRFDIPSGSDTASVINRGAITTAEGGLAALVAPGVENSGVIQARLGKVELASANTFTLDLYGDRLIQVAVDDKVLARVTGADGSVLAAAVASGGKIIADGGRVVISANAARDVVNQVVNMSGVVRARTVAQVGGEIVLDGGSAGIVQVAGTLDASGVNAGEGGGVILAKGADVRLDGMVNAASVTDRGGSVTVDAGWMSVGGSVAASGVVGGDIVIATGGLSLAGSLSATGRNGAGGRVDIANSGKSWEYGGSVIDVSGAVGGTIRNLAKEQISSSAVYKAIGASGKGGKIDVSASATKLLTASLDASGATGGGRVRIGGEYQGGKNLAVDELANATQVALNDGVVVRADTTGTDGDGGTLITWANLRAVTFASYSAKPGSVSGLGGFIEISSGDTLTYGGTAQAGIGGRKGNVLFDPKNIVIAGDDFSQQSIILGYNYSGNSKDVNASLDSNDFFGSSVSLDGNRLAVGARKDDGSGNALGSSGAVYLFTFTDAAYSGGALAATVGKGYTGGKNVNVTALEANDNFGVSVSLDGNRLAVGADQDGGARNTAAYSGAVYLFTFTDGAFTSGALAATLGKGYAGGKNVDVSTLGGVDLFGVSVSLDGSRLAVGARNDDGSGNATTNSGAAYLFTFTDGAFTGGALAAVLGKGYTGGKNLNVSALAVGDVFGQSVSLDGNRLAVGAFGDDGPGDATSNSGAVYLFSFSDNAFSGGSLIGTLGKGYRGGKSLDVAALEANDQFGHGVSLDGNRLAVGAWRDGGSGNVATTSGAVYLFSFSDSAFSGGALTATLGKGYTGGKNLDVAALEANDFFGTAVSLDGNRLAVGAYNDSGSGNALSTSGAVYLFSFTDSSFSGGARVATVGSGYTTGRDINVGGTSTRTDVSLSALELNDAFGTAVSLNGNRLAVGAYQDDGAAVNGAYNSGAVYLFTFTNAAFTGGALAATVGKGYTGGKNVDVTALGASDFFGSSVSLDGTKLAVGAINDDGPGDATSNSGAVYLFSFTDSAFTGGSLIGTLGKGYTGSGSFNVTAVGANDGFGSGVSLDGTRLAVGASAGSGFGDTALASGEVYLFTFADSTLTSASSVGTLGKGHAGARSLGVAALEAGDSFGSSVSLNGNRLAVGAYQDDGPTNATANSGAVYLFTFTGSTFTGPALAGTVGKGYTTSGATSGGASSIDVAAVAANDWFGRGVSLDGNRLAVGASQDDGSGDRLSNSGGVYLFTFTNSNFAGGVHAATLGRGYTGGKNVNFSTLGRADLFGASVSLDGNRLAVGASADDGASTGPLNSIGNSGAVHIYTFTDSAFTGGARAITVGRGYTGSTSVFTAALAGSDRFGYAVSLDGTRLAVGAPLDDGPTNATANGGAVYLFTFTDSAFSGGALAATLGKGYTGGKNVDVAALEANDSFGTAVSLSGNRLAVGARSDGGSGNGASGSGTVYLFNFTDSTFSSGALAATLGKGYTGGKNVNVAALEANDNFGVSVSLDGNRLAVGAQNDGGSGNAADSSGAVYLFTFTDSAFSGGALAATLGKGYSGGKNVGLTALAGGAEGSGDRFGLSVSLDGNRLAVGALGDDGPANATSNSGAVYLFTFTDSLFSGGALAATVGKGYTGGKNIDVAALEAVDTFGSGVSLDGIRLAVGARNDDGSGNALGNSGAVYLFDFHDNTFSGGALTATLGKGYSGGKNVNVAALGATDQFGQAVSLDGGRLAVGAYGDKGSGDAAPASTGAAYLFDFAFDPAADGGSYGKRSSADLTISASALAKLLSSAQNVTLQASNDITVSKAIYVDNSSGNGGNLTLQAGRSVKINANVTTDNGNLTLIGNDTAANGVVGAHRESGTAVITMPSGVTINAGTGTVKADLRDGTGNTFTAKGTITSQSSYTALQVFANGRLVFPAATTTSSTTATAVTVTTSTVTKQIDGVSGTRGFAVLPPAQAPVSPAQAVVAATPTVSGYQVDIFNSNFSLAGVSAPVLQSQAPRTANPGQTPVPVPVQTPVVQPQQPLANEGNAGAPLPGGEAVSFGQFFTMTPQARAQWVADGGRALGLPPSIIQRAQAFLGSPVWNLFGGV